MPAVGAGSVSADHVRKMIVSALIVVFSKTYCPYCQRAKRLLTQLGLEFAVFELDEIADGSAIQQVLASISGCRTVPQIFIGGDFVGGCDALHALHDQGKLIGMVSEKRKIAA